MSTEYKRSSPIPGITQHFQQKSEVHKNVQKQKGDEVPDEIVERLGQVYTEVAKLVNKVHNISAAFGAKEGCQNENYKKISIEAGKSGLELQELLENRNILEGGYSLK